MKYTIEATIPVVQYGNLKPVIEVESPEDEALAVDTIKRLWERFGETPIKDKNKGGIIVETFTGEQILWNEGTHTYTDMAGNVLLSGSKYADMHSPKFDMDMLAPKTAKAWGVDESALRSIWKFNGEVATNYGTAIHKALELYHIYYEEGAKIQAQKELDHSYILPKNKYLRDIVISFIEQFGINAKVEVLVSDVANKMAGTIDRLEFVADNTVRVGDYKTNVEMDAKKLLKYQKQLSYYAHILINKGYKVQGLDLFHLDQNDGWVRTQLDVLDLED